MRIPSLIHVIGACTRTSLKIHKTCNISHPCRLVILKLVAGISQYQCQHALKFGSDLTVISSLCIMCVQYRGGAQYCGGVQYCGEYHERGGYLEYCRDVQYRGGCHDKCGDILNTVGVFSTRGGGILSAVGDTQYRRGYHDACGGYH